MYAMQFLLNPQNPGAAGSLPILGTIGGLGSLAAYIVQKVYDGSSEEFGGTKDYDRLVRERPRWGCTIVETIDNWDPTPNE